MKVPPKNSAVLSIFCFVVFRPLVAILHDCLSTRKNSQESLRVIVRKTKVEFSASLSSFTSAVQRASSGQSVKDFSDNFSCDLLSCSVAGNGRRLGVQAGEHKTFKFPQNFLRAYTSHDAKPLVIGWRFFYVVTYQTIHKI